jgi:hypothetical protein
MSPTKSIIETERAQIQSAYEEAVRKLFGVLFESMIVGVSDTQPAARFRRGLQLARAAREQSLQIVEESKELV